MELAIRLTRSRFGSRFIPPQLNLWATMWPSVIKLYSGDEEQVLEAVRQVVIGPSDLLNLDQKVLELWMREQLPRKVLDEYTKLTSDVVISKMLHGTTRPSYNSMPKQLYSIKRLIKARSKRYEFNLYFMRIVNILLVLVAILFLFLALYKCCLELNPIGSLLPGGLTIAVLVSIFIVKPFDRMHCYTTKIEEIMWLNCDIEFQFSALNAIECEQERANKIHELIARTLAELRKYR